MWRDSSGSPPRSWEVINNNQELRFKLSPDFFISSKPEALTGLAIAARKTVSDPPYAQQILSAIYHEFGPSDEFQAELGKFRGESQKALVVAAVEYFKAHPTNPIEMGVIFKRASDNIEKESRRLVSHKFKRIIKRVDPYFAMAAAAVEPVPEGYTVEEGYSVELESDINDDGKDKWTPNKIPKGKNLDEFIHAEILRETGGTQWKLEEISRNIKGAVESGSATLFTRPNLELAISKERIKDNLYANIIPETTADSEVLADVLDAYRTALTYIATEGRSSYPILDHWRELRKTRKPADEKGEQENLEKTANFDNTFSKVVEHHRADATSASIIVRQALGPIMARMIEEKAQFIDETFPLHPRKVIWYDEGKRTVVSLPERLREDVDRQRKVKVTGELQQAQQRKVIARGDVLLQILEDCQKLFTEVAPEEMAKMYPLLTAGAMTADRNTIALALSQAAQSTASIAQNLDRTFETKVEFPAPEGADTLLQDFAKTLGKDIGVEYASMGDKKTVTIPGLELYRVLQEKTTPAGLKRKIASFVLRKFVGYPPDLNKTPDILGDLNTTRRQELVEFRNRVPPGDPFFDITSDKDFRPEEARKLIRLRLKLVHPDVSSDNPVKRHATFLYNEIMAYMDVLEQEKGEGIWASMKDI